MAQQTDNVGSTERLISLLALARARTDGDCFTMDFGYLDLRDLVIAESEAIFERARCSSLGLLVLTPEGRNNNVADCHSPGQVDILRITDGFAVNLHGYPVRHAMFSNLVG
jgi:hypothetical protein